MESPKVSTVDFCFGIFMTVFHLSLSLIMAYGVLFSKTPTQAYSVLCCLVVMLLMIRYFNGCAATVFEKNGILETSRLGRAFILKDSEKVDIPLFEEIAVGTLTILQIIRTITITIRSPEVLF